MSEPVTVQVIESPAEALRRLALVEDLPREDLWDAIATAVTDIHERMAVLEADADARRQVVDAIQRRVSAPLDARPVQPG